MDVAMRMPAYRTRTVTSPVVSRSGPITLTRIWARPAARPRRTPFVSMLAVVGVRTVQIVRWPLRLAPALSRARSGAVVPPTITVESPVTTILTLAVVGEGLTSLSRSHEIVSKAATSGSAIAPRVSRLRLRAILIKSIKSRGTLSRKPTRPRLSTPCRPLFLRRTFELRTRMHDPENSDRGAGCLMLLMATNNRLVTTPSHVRP